MVLATDMKQHFSIHSMFQAKMHLNGSSRNSGGASSRGMPGGGPPGGTPDTGDSKAAGGAARTTDSGNAAGGGARSAGAVADRVGSGSGLKNSPQTTGSDASQVRAIDDDQRSLALQVALKCADLGHLASPRPVHRRWVACLEEEFFRQGDREKGSGLGVSPLMDREKNGISKSQMGFFDIVALPLFQSLAAAFSETTPMLDAVRDNYHMWRDESVLFSGAQAR